MITITIDNQKQCNTCKEWKRATNEFFGNDKAIVLGLASRCKSCIIKKNRNQRKSNVKRIITIDNQKECSRCKEWRPATNEFFGNKKNGPLGLRSCCKICDSEDARKWKEENTERYNENKQKWREANKDRHVKSSRKWAKKNKEKVKQNQKKWVEENKEKVKQNKKKWHELNPEKGAAHNQTRRALKANADGTATAEQIKARFQFHENRCYYCGDNESGLHVEHRIPLSRGGSNWPSNLVPACPTCNWSKHTKTEKEFINQ